MNLDLGSSSAARQTAQYALLGDWSVLMTMNPGFTDDWLIELGNSRYWK
jgi:hypothetical protein